MLISEEGMKDLKAAHSRRERIRELLTKYPEPWVIEKEPHSYQNGTTEFTYVRVTPDLAELLILLREHAQETIVGAR